MADSSNLQWFDLTLAQQPIWLDAAVGSASAYQLGLWVRLREALDAETLRQAVALLTARHEALRLRIDAQLPRQRLAEASSPAPFRVVELESGQTFDDYTRRCFSASMPLGEHPLFTVELIAEGGAAWFLLLRFHHLIADLSSVYLFAAALMEAYEALADGNPSAALAPPTAYRPQAVSDAAYLSSTAYQRDLAYWTERFDPLPEPLVATSHASGEARRVPVAHATLSGEEWAAFARAAAELDLAPARVLTALFAVAMGRRYGQTEIVTGVALHGRDGSTARTLGMFSGMLPVRCQFEDYWSIAECAQAFDEQMTADFKHHRLPVDHISRSAGLTSTGRGGLFELATSHMPSRPGEDGLRRLALGSGLVQTREASPISFHTSGGAAAMHLSVAVNPDLLPGVEAEPLLELARHAAACFAADAEGTRFSDLPAITDAERVLVTQTWSASPAPEFPQARLDALFAAQATRTPEALAVVGVHGETYTYAELDAASARVARRLVQHGVRRGSVVGVRMERSSDTVLALLGILKAGGVYLPLDPAYPPERLAFMAADAGTVLVIESLAALGADDPSVALPAACDPGEVAYLIYTSGTTGQPKGVAVPHRAAVNLAFARRACHDPIGPGDRVLAAISVGFDVSIGQLLLPLLAGATVVVSADLKTMDAAEFWRFLTERGVTHINSVPSFVESILEAAPADASPLKRLMMGGEALSGNLVERIQARLPGVEVVNMYGPTETCIDATYHVARPEDLSAAVLPIGRPLSNYTAYIVNEHMELVGVGVPGELCIGGPSLADRYLNQPELTAERFVANPFGPGRLYRTGDRARWRAQDGAIEFLGRTDQQVKIRGFRVEPGEVAAALLQQPAVAQAAVVALGPAGNQRLVAYFVPRGEVPETARLRDHLGQRLPDYMMPAAYVAIDRIPINVNGKLDVRALPAPQWSEGEYVAPRTATEELVAALFAAQLHLDRCSATANFFDLGGHSLLAASLASQARQAGIEMGLSDVFAAPTVEALARRIDERAVSAGAVGELGAAPERPARVPLSFAQERIWFVDRLQQDASYNIPMAVELRGRLDRAAVVRALNGLVERHEALRTRIVLDGGRPVQVVDAAAPLAMPDAQLREDELPAYLRQWTRRRFRLEAEWPVAVTLVRVDAERHVLCALIHHVAFDGWSAGLFFSEFAALYRGEALPVLSWQYADFSVWQRSQDYQRQREFWIAELSGAPARLDLPVRALTETRTASTTEFQLDAPLHAALRQVARDHEASLFMVLHAALAVLLGRWSGQDDIVIGTVTANRERREFEAIVGCFVNTLALRTRLEAGQTFRELLGRVRERDLAAFEHQSLPFEQLVEALVPERSLYHTPIFQVLLVLQNTPSQVVKLPGVDAAVRAVEPEQAKFDLTVTFAEQSDGSLGGAIEYARERLTAADMDRLITRLRQLLEAAAADPDRTTAQLSQPGAVEKALVATGWNQTAQSFPTGTLDALFTAQAAARPHDTAVIDTAGRVWSYAEIDAESAKVARYLAGRGVRRESVVGVRMARSVETVIAALGIWKAGGVYLPLDPSLPAERLAYLVADAGAVLVLETIAGLDGEATPEGSSDPHQLAYIIYTSGTTGQPKGVAVEHASAVNLLHARRAGYDPLGPGEVVLGSTSIGFDVSVGQLVFPLIHGATLVVAGDIRTMGAAALWDLVDRHGVTQINFVPSFFESMLAAGQGRGGSLRRILLGGEALSGSLARRVRAAFPQAAIVNVYGPTEATIDATCHMVSEVDFSTAVLPIGRPLANYQAYILDADGVPCGIGVAGELYLGGLGLARGYVNAPKLTAERFVPNPFGEGRLYKTGDRARWRDDGVIEYLGREDQQVKIRGFRIELGEIEAQLRAQPGVEEAAVIADRGAHTTRLLAYYTGAPSQTATALRAALSAALPDYMVPAAFLRLERLPLNHNGKLDRRALPAPPPDAFAAGEAGYQTPEGELETKLSAWWAELLGLERVGRHDNFFALGGHSLLAVTLMDRLHREGLNADIRALFQAPTVAGLAAAVNESSAVVIEESTQPLLTLTEEQTAAVVAHVPGGAGNVQDMYPLAPLQEGILFQYLVTADGDPYVSPTLLAFDSPARRAAFLTALNGVVARHDVLRTSFVWEGVPAPVQVVHREAAVEVEDAGVISGAALVERFDATRYRMDLRRAPLVRAVTAEDEQGRTLLLLLAHHLVLDHTSMEILVGELRALMADPQAALPAPQPYRTFIAQTLQSRATGHDDYFAAELGDVEETTEPFGLSRLNGPVEEVRLRLESGLSQRIRQRARLLGVGAASVFHLAWAAVLGHAAGREDVVFGTVLLGRMHSGGTGAGGVVGMFINTLPVRVRLNETAVSDAVRRMHEALITLTEHEHASLSAAQRASRIAPPAPLFAALFNFRYSPEAEAGAWPGVEILHGSERTNYPVAMAVDDSGRDFHLTALVDRTAANVCAYLAHAVAELVRLLEQAPLTPLAQLDMLPEATRRQVVAGWNQTELAVPPHTLERLFAEQAARTPNATAVVDVDGFYLSYAELDTLSTQMARRLSAAGVNAGDVVGVRRPRAAATIVSLLGILKAGAVYLPLDPAYPAARLDFMVTHSRAVLVLDEDTQLTDEAEVPAPADDPSRCAYIIYTSGTTGQPKGVAVPHRAAVNLAWARRAGHDPIGPGDCVLAGISVGFDVSIGQLLLPLLAGATVVVAPDLKSLGAREFWRFVVDRGVTHINSVPSFFDSILDAAPPQTPLKRVMLGGEALTGALVRRLRVALGAGVEIVNMYGPTEACIDATCHVATPGDEERAVLPIGRPLANYRAYVLDHRLRPVGPHVPGELYLGGAGLADGYVGDAALTQARFVTWTETAERLYRTGDRAAWNRTGGIEFLGRVDEQVKIRGFRVEPGEVEARLREHAGVRDAAVIAHNGTLVAYFTGTASAEELRTALAAQLPPYMVPASCVPLAALPLTPNGKLDKRALPRLQPAVRSFTPPEGDLETRLAAIWQEVLQSGPVGRHDNFFELGGHSLAAISLIERMRQQGFAADVRTLFENATIAGLAAAMASATTAATAPRLEAGEHERALAARWVNGGEANLQDVYPLAPLQEGILFQHLVTPDADPYLVRFLLAFDERPRLDRFVAALVSVAARHDVLRTGFLWQELDQPIQYVARRAEVPVEELDRAMTAEELLAGAHRLDLRRAPLLRAVVTPRRDAPGWLLLLLSHHLIVDHTSMEIVVHELRELTRDAAPALPAALPYRPFVEQARASVADEARHLAFFRAELGDVDEATEPFGLRAQGGEVFEESRLLDIGVGRRLREHARRLGVTPAALFHLAWGAVLAHASSRPDVVFGTVLLGRMAAGAGADRVVGMFINTLPMRLRFDASLPVAEAVRQTQSILARLLAHEHTPLVLAQRASGVAAPAPLITSLFNYRYSPAGNSEPWPGVEILHNAERTNYPVAMAVDDTGEEFRLTALVEAPARSSCRLLEQALTSLTALLDGDATSPLGSLSVLPGADEQLVVEQWNRTDLPAPHATLDRLFAEQAARTPQATALVDIDGAEYSYARLDAESTELARYLRGAGIVADDVVGVRRVRSAATVISLLGILKAGATYLPLDPAYPAARLDFMIGHAGAKLVLDESWTPGATADLPALAEDPERTAYLIYTSGTTGEPKGVAVPHRAAVNLAYARRAAHDPIGLGDRILGAISVGFDVSIGQLLLPLLSGATIVIAPDLATLGAAEFWRWINERGVTHVNSVPSFFDSILEAAPPATSLKQVMLGGEALTGALIQRLHKRLAGVRVVNMYGPTEACIDATYHVVTAADEQRDVAPIGRPLGNYHAYVLDAQRRPVAARVAGELYLGGAGLAHGYLHDAALTAQRFFVWERNGERLYRTGDRARWNAAGQLEFLGRVDEQVKIRGFRVEPGEVEARLRAQPGVKEAAVVAWPTGLAAYYTGTADASAVRAALSAELPPYMVPANLTLLPALPLTANGKLDRRALPAPAAETRLYEAPVGDIETRLAALWQQVLGSESAPGRHDHFFDAGGHSLAAMRLVNMAEREFQCTLAMRDLLANPTIAGMAALIGAGPAAEGAIGNVVVLQAGAPGVAPLYCIHPAGGHVFCYLPLARSLGAAQPVIGLQSSGLEASGSAMPGSIEEIARGYVEQIQARQPQGPYRLLGMSSGGLIAFEMARQLGPRQVASLTLLDTTVPGPAEPLTGAQLLQALGGEIGCADLAASATNLAELFETAQSQGRLPAGLTLAVLERIAAVFANTVACHFAYAPQAWTGNALLVRALQRGRAGDAPPDWSRYISGDLSVHDLPCRHEDLVSSAWSPQVSALVLGQMTDSLKAQ